MARYFHVWFSTKRRRAVLEGEIEERLRALFISIASSDGISVLELEFNFDHVHLLLALTGTQQLPWALKQLKGRSAYELFSAIPELKLDMHSQSLWQKGYGWREVLPYEVSIVRSYIRTQKERLHRH
jgi:putative transposase